MSASPDGFIFILLINTSKNYQNILPNTTIRTRTQPPRAGWSPHPPPATVSTDIMPHLPSPPLHPSRGSRSGQAPTPIAVDQHHDRVPRRGISVNLPVPRWALGLGLPGRASSGVSGRREGKAGPTRSREQRGPRVRRSASTARRGRVHSVSRSPGKRVLLLLGFQDY